MSQDKSNERGFAAMDAEERRRIAEKGGETTASQGFRLLVRARKPVADSADGLDEGGLVGFGLDLVAKTPDVDLEVLRFVPILRSPYTREQGVVRERLAGVRCELRKEIELGWREVDVLAGAANAARRQVDREVVRIDGSRTGRARY